MRKERIAITVKEAEEMGYTHFLRDSREVIEPLEDFAEIVEESKEPHRGLPDCWLVDPKPEIPYFDSESLLDFLREYHEELPEVSHEQMDEFINEYAKPIADLIDSMNERIRNEAIAFTYKPTIYLLREG